ncbi:hypothetical protein D3C72_881280 [compost metagenome]
MENPDPALGFDLPQAFELRCQFPWIEGLLRGQALLFPGHAVLAHFLEMAFEQVAVDQRVAIVERQRQPAVGLGELMQHRQDRVRLGEPFEHGVANHQIVRFSELPEQFLPRRLDECCGLPGVGEALARAVEHRCGGLGEGYVMAALGQPQRHVAEAAANVEHSQRTIRQCLD